MDGREDRREGGGKLANKQREIMYGKNERKTKTETATGQSE